MSEDTQNAAFAALGDARVDSLADLETRPGLTFSGSPLPLYCNTKVAEAEIDGAPSRGGLDDRDVAIVQAAARVSIAAILALALIVCSVIFSTGCDESDAPAVHGVISVSPSPLPPFEVRFREDEPSPTPVEW